MSFDEVTPIPNQEPEEPAGPHDALGAYLLGALPEDERSIFEAHLRDCAQCQQELQELQPIAAVLPRLYDDLEVPELADLSATADPSDAVRASILTEAVEQGQPADVETEEVAIVDTPAVESVEVVEETVEIAGAIPETPAAPAAPATGATVVPIERKRRSIWPWAAAAAAALIAIGSILWTLAMLDEVNNLKDERALQNQQIAELIDERAEYLDQTAALVYRLVATTEGVEDSSATIYLDPDPDGWGGIVAVRNLPAAPEGQTYQLWMITDGVLSPGPTFQTDADNRAIVQVTGGEVADAGQMAVTMEPTGGSETATTAPIMQGNLTV